MKQNPSQLKFKKYHRVSSSFLSLKEQKSFFLSHEYSLKFIEPAHLTFSQLESCRKVIKRGTRDSGFFSLNTLCFHPVTEKAVSSRMGKGKGNFKRWIKIVRKGSVFCGVSGINVYRVFKLFKGLQSKLPVKTKIFKLIY